MRSSAAVPIPFTSASSSTDVNPPFRFRSASTVLITVISFLLVLQEAGLDVKTVLGGAAILGVAIAFGAQNLMRDYFTGFLILLEDQFEIGDLKTTHALAEYHPESDRTRVCRARDIRRNAEHPWGR